MTNDNQEIVTPEDHELFRDIAKEIRNNPGKYSEAGKWLDEYCSETGYWQRQENKLKELQAQEKRFPTLPIAQHVRQLEKDIEVRRTPALIIRFQEARNNLIEKYKDQQFIPEDDSKKIIIIAWLLTDPDAEKSNLKITQLKEWSWEPIDDVTKLSRGYANFLWFQGGKAYGPWMNLIRIAWSKLTTENDHKASESNRIFGDTWTVGGVPIRLRNIVSKVKGLKRRQKVISCFGLCIVILVIVAFSTHPLWLPLIGKLASDSGETSVVTEHAGHPTVIFDARGSIHVDDRAMQYLEKIEVEEVGTLNRMGEKESHVDELRIIVTPKQHLAYGPLIEPLGGLRDIIIYDPKRGIRHQWIYQVLIRPPYGGDIKTQKFKLEILR